MNTSTKPANPRRRVWLKHLGILVILGLAVIMLASIASGYGLNLRAYGRSVISLAQTVLNHDKVSNPLDDYRNIIFLHHSVGANLINEGGVRELFATAGYDFWDHDYNWAGLRDPAGRHTGYSYNVPDDNTDPDGLAAIFTQPAYGLPINTYSALLQHQVIAFKSCYPVSNVVSDEQLAHYKSWYLQIRDAMDKHPDKIFIVVTQPPLIPAETTHEAAVRARAFANWLKSDEFLGGHPNIFTFDLFGQLAENNPGDPGVEMLRQSYRNGTDSHPNRIANETIGPQFVSFVINTIEKYKQTRSGRTTF